MVWIRLAIPIGKPFPSSSPTFCTEMGPSLSVRFLDLPFSDTSWSCPVTTMIIVMIAVKDLLIMTLARSARAVRGEGLVPPLWIPTTPPALELELCPAICMFANHFKGSPLQVTLNQAQISVIFYFSSFLFSNVSPIYHLYFSIFSPCQLLKKHTYVEPWIYYFVSISWSKSPG